MSLPPSRILAYNLLALLGAAGLLRLLIREESQYGISGYAALLALVIVVLFFHNLAQALLADSGRRGAWVLAAVLVLLVGFGVRGRRGVNSQNRGITVIVSPRSMPSSVMEPELPPSNHILRNNLLGVLAAAVLLGALAPSTHGSSAIPFVVIYGVQVLVNLGLGVGRLLSSRPGPSAAPYFLSALLVLIIGFGACGMMVLTNLGNMH